LRRIGPIPAVSDRNSGIVLNGFMIGSSVPTVSMIALPTSPIGFLPNQSVWT